MKYRKKAVEIEALEWDGIAHATMYRFLEDDENGYITPEGKNFYIDHNRVAGGLIIKTLEGEHVATIGDFIIKGVEGEYYPCKATIFNKTYDKC